jgi:hypothetical protein
MNTDAIFISYRRKDAGAWAMWLESQLHARYGEDSVFRDLTSLRLGDRFEQEIHRVLDCCRAAIVVIGHSWLSLPGDSGTARLFEPDDIVRREIERALDRDDVIVIPVLVDGTRMPAAHELPAGLERLSGYQALDLSDGRRMQDMGLLFEALERTGITPKPVAATAGAPAPSSMPAVAAAAMTAAAGIGAKIATTSSNELAAHRFDSADVAQRVAAYAAGRATLWAIVGALALATGYVLLGRGSWLGRAVGAVGLGARGLALCGLAGAAGGALFIALKDGIHFGDFSANCGGLMLTGLILGGAFARLSSASERRYYLLTGLVGGLLTGAIGASRALSGNTGVDGMATAGGHIFEAVLLVGIFALTLAGLAMAPAVSTSGALGKT